MASLRKFELGAFTQNSEVASPMFVPASSSAAQTPASASNFATNNNNNSYPVTPRDFNNSSLLTPRENGGDGAATGVIANTQPAAPPPPPSLKLEGQRPIDKKYLYSSATVRFVGYVHTSEVFVEGKSGGINSDLIDKASARGGQDPCDAVMKLNRVWKERTFVVEPSVKGWTLHILKAKLGGENTIKHSILLSSVENIDIMTSQQPGRKFSVRARTTADTQAKTHFQLDFQSYISISLGKQHLEITCKSPDAVIRNYTFLVNCLHATAILTQHFSALIAAEQKIDQEQVSMHFKTIINDGNNSNNNNNTDPNLQQSGNYQTAPLRFDCVFSLSTKPQEPYVQLRGTAIVSTATLKKETTASAGTGKAAENIKIQGKFRILLHPHNLRPPMTEEGVVFLVQSDEQHMLPVEIRPVPGKSKKVHDKVALRDAVVEAIDKMLTIAEAMSGPKLAVEALNKTGNAVTASEVVATSTFTTTNNINNNINNIGQQDLKSSSSPLNNNNINGNQQLPMVPGKLASSAVISSMNNQNQSQTSPTSANRNSNRWNVLSATSRMAFGTGFGSDSPNNDRRSGSPSNTYNNNNNSNRYNLRQGNVVEQLEAGARARLEISFLELLRSLCVSAMPSRRPSTHNKSATIVYPTIPHDEGNFHSSSPHRLAAQQNTNYNSYVGWSEGQQQQQQQHPLPTSPRFVHHQMQRNGSVPIAVSQLSHAATSPATDTSGRAYKVMMDPQTAEQIVSERRRMEHSVGGGNHQYGNRHPNHTQDMHEYYGNPASPFHGRLSSSPATSALLGNNAWEFKHTATWPLMMPGDDPQDFRLHIARILKHRAGKGLTEGSNNNNLQINGSNNNNTSSSPTQGAATSGLIVNNTLTSVSASSSNNNNNAAASSPRR